VNNFLAIITGDQSVVGVDVLGKKLKAPLILEVHSNGEGIVSLLLQLLF
jgi:hypothetical protein